MSDDLKLILLRINGVDKPLANKIVNSGVSLRQLHQANFIALAYELDVNLANVIRFAADKFARAAREAVLFGDALDAVRCSGVTREALMAIGLTARDAESLVLFEARSFDLALEDPETLRQVLGFEQRDCVRAIALARLITLYEGEANDLMEFLKQRK